MVEKEVHTALGGQWESDNKFYDVALPNGHDFMEVKSATKGNKKNLSVHADALLRKVEGIQAAGAGATMHTLFADDRPGATHRWHYKRGSAAYGFNSMHKAKDLNEVKRLIAMPDDQLPELARGSLPKGDELAKLKEQAKTAQESRRKKDQAYKARLKAAGTSAYVRAAERGVTDAAR